MKKLLLIPLTMLLACGAAFSQGTVKNRAIKNNSYFNLSYIRPIMDYGKIEGNESPNNMLKYYKKKAGDDLQHYSAGLNVGANFYIHPVSWIIEGFKPGLCVDFIDLGVDYYRFNDGVQNQSGVIDTTKYSDLTASYSLNVGVIATINPVKNFYIDLTAKICPTFAVNYFKIPAYKAPSAIASWDVYEYRMPGDQYGGYDVSGSIYPVPDQEAEDTGIGLGLDYAFGFNLRYSKVSIGCEWFLGNIRYSYDTWTDQKVNNQRLKVKLGLSFD